MNSNSIVTIKMTVNDVNLVIATLRAGQQQAYKDSQPGPSDLSGDEKRKLRAAAVDLDRIIKQIEG
jgi:hypothetical protein